MDNKKVSKVSEEKKEKKVEVKKEISRDSLEKAVAQAEKKSVFAGVDFDKLEITMPALLKAGAHFGHQKSRYNPQMKDFIYTTRNNISIIDLAQTVELMKESLKFLAQVKSSGKQILFVGTKKQAQPVVVATAEMTKNPFVVERWLGGTFTNFGNIRKRVRYMSRLKEQMDKGELKKYTKFEQVKKTEEYNKLNRRMGGIVDMANLPGAIFITDLNSDKLAVKEAKKMKVPIVAIADTNVNPVDADYLIPANDDAVSSLKFIMANVCKVLK
jgi:small subunit ribosomal protein S2